MVFAKLISGFISNKKEKISDALSSFKNQFGPVDIVSEDMIFKSTDHYNKELGSPLVKRLCSFKKLISLEHSHKIKLFSCKLEEKMGCQGKRSVNIDPGYVDLAKMVLFTTKDYAHRIYLAENIFAEITLKFDRKEKSFISNPWTYNDYKSDKYISFFNEVRRVFSKQIM